MPVIYFILRIVSILMIQKREIILQEGLNNLNTDLEKLNGVWVSRYEVTEKPQPFFSKILAFLNNETFMDIIN